jgi:uncharacterized protein (DUF427 family)
VSQREHKIPGPDHPITVEPTVGRVVVRAGDRVVADTTAALTLTEATYPPVQYIPLSDVDPAVITPTSTTSYCPYKGEASYYTLIGPDGAEEDAIWTYADPYPEVGAIAGHVAFYPNKVETSINS